MRAFASIGLATALGLAMAAGCGDDSGNIKGDGAVDAAGTGGKIDAPAGDVPSGTGGAGGATDGGAGGAGGVDGGVAPGTLFSFDADLQKFALDTWQDGRPGMAVNLAALATDGGVPVGLTWSASGGNPAGGMKITATFSDYAQYVNAQVKLAAPQNWAGRKVKAWFRIDALAPGLLGSGGIKLMAQASTFYTFGAAGAGWCALPTSSTNWFQCTLDLSALPAAMVSYLTIQLATGSGSAEAGVPSDDVTLYVDTITLE